MKRNTAILLMSFSIIFCSCNKEQKSYERGTYVSYNQTLSPIYAFTADGPIDGSDINIKFPPFINEDGEVIDNPQSGSDPLHDLSIEIDSIKLTTNGNAYIYSFIVSNPLYSIERKKDSLFLIATSDLPVFKFSSVDLLNTRSVVVSDSKEAELYKTMRATYHDNELVLYSYNFFFGRSQLNFRSKNLWYGSYLDLDYLRSQLQAGDTLAYVKKSTFFRKD